MAAPIEYRDHADREDDLVYFGMESSTQSWARPLDEDEDMPEDVVRDYIKDNDPMLFKKLRGLPVSSRDIPMSYEGQRTMQRLSGIIQSIRHRQQGIGIDTAGRALQPIVNQASTKSLPVVASSNAAMIAKARQSIQHKLASGYVLYQQTLTPLDAPVPCDFVLCPQSRLDFSNLEYCVVELDRRTQKYSQLQEEQADRYCVGCFNVIHGDGQTQKRKTVDYATLSRDRLVLDGLLDGVDQPSILEAAGRLYPHLPPIPSPKKSVFGDKGTPDYAFNHPSNSPRNHQLRAFKMRELNRTLAEVARFEKARGAATQVTPPKLRGQKSSDLTIMVTRPAFMEPKPERYKKQGLTESDYKKDLKARKESGDYHPYHRPAGPLASPVKTPENLRETICLCRGYNDGKEILKCSSELCPIGWFHLHCTGLDRLPTINQQFFCCFCSDAVDTPVIKDSVVSGDPNVMSQGNTPVSATFTDDNSYEDDFDDAEEEGSSPCGMDWTTGTNTFRKEINRWAAVNDPGSSPAADRFTDQSEQGSESGTTLSEGSEMDAEDSICAQLTSAKRYASTGTSSSATHQPPASSMSEANRPVTPPSRAIQPASKPWGTPINLEKYTIDNIPSPSPRRRRMEQHANAVFRHGVRVDTPDGIEDSEDGEVVQLIVDKNILRELNR